MRASTAATYIFTAPTTCRTAIITLEPCALNAETQHFILRFNIIGRFQEYKYYLNLILISRLMEI
jgi:hypothetical protein